MVTDVAKSWQTNPGRAVDQLSSRCPRRVGGIAGRRDRSLSTKDVGGVITGADVRTQYRPRRVRLPRMVRLGWTWSGIHCGATAGCAIGVHCTVRRVRSMGRGRREGLIWPGTIEMTGGTAQIRPRLVVRTRMEPLDRNGSGTIGTASATPASGTRWNVPRRGR